MTTTGHIYAPEDALFMRLEGDPDGPRLSEHTADHVIDAVIAEGWRPTAAEPAVWRSCPRCSADVAPPPDVTDTADWCDCTGREAGR